MIREQILETITMNMLYQLGYEYERKKCSELIIQKDLIKAIKKINEQITEKQVNETIEQIKKLAKSNQIENNKRFTEYLQEGVTIEGEKKIKIIDFENIENNVFKVCDEYKIMNMNIDIVIFINGLPLVVIELKQERNTLEKAYSVLKKYQEKLYFSLFNYNQFMVITNGERAKVGTITSAWNEFKEWKKIEKEDEIRTDMNTYHTLMKGMFRKDRILDIMANFILWKDKEKILGAYHQYFGIRKAIQKTNITVENHTKKAGIFCHTSGSGKTNSVIFYVQNILKNYKNANILILTEQKELRKQLLYTYSKCFEFSSIKLEEIEKGQDFQKLEKLEKQNIIFISIQQLKRQKGIINQRNDIFVIVDDVKKSSNGEELTRKIEELFPNATYIEFTSMLLEEMKRQEDKVFFGDIIDEYDITQAMTDNLTLPVIYEQKEILKDKVFQKIENKSVGDRLSENATRTGILVKDMIQHYEKIENSIANKAMVITHSIEAANNIYNKLMELKPEWKNKVKLIVSTTKHIMTNAKNLEIEFKDMRSEFKIAIVVDMWVTGMEVPGLGVVYIDKPMQIHTLLQTIARVNRPYKNKMGGLLIDYVGLSKKVLEKVSSYTQGGMIKTTNVKERMLEKIEMLKKIFSAFHELDKIECLDDYEIIKQGAENVLATEKQKNLFMEYSSELKNAYPLCIEKLEKKQLYEILFFVSIRSVILKTLQKEIDLKEINCSKAQILEEKMREDELFKITEMAIDKKEFFIKLKELPQKNLATMLFIVKLEEWIENMEDNNLALKEKFFHQFVKIQKEYKMRENIQDADKIILELKMLKERIDDEMKKAEEYHLSAQEKAIFDILVRDLQQYDSQVFIKIAKELKVVANVNMKEDWNTVKVIKERLKIELEKVLIKDNYPLNKIEKVTQFIMIQLENLY